eukprot:scaffold230582_cov18-Prasinocladus_malaysianus.AAC.1
MSGRLRTSTRTELYATATRATFCLPVHKRSPALAHKSNDFSVPITKYGRVRLVLRAVRT